jgi:hypothetical protein
MRDRPGMCSHIWEVTLGKQDRILPPPPAPHAANLPAMEKVWDGVRNVVRVVIIEGPGGPRKAVGSWWPYPIKTLPARQRKSPHSAKATHRRTYDLNKELADYLRSRMTIIIGGSTTRTLDRVIIRKHKKWRCLPISGPLLPGKVADPYIPALIGGHLLRSHALSVHVMRSDKL